VRLPRAARASLSVCAVHSRTHAAAAAKASTRSVRRILLSRHRLIRAALPVRFILPNAPVLPITLNGGMPVSSARAYALRAGSSPVFADAGLVRQ
jgi:hypothetical protein